MNIVPSLQPLLPIEQRITSYNIEKFMFLELFFGKLPKNEWINSINKEKFFNSLRININSGALLKVKTVDGTPYVGNPEWEAIFAEDEWVYGTSMLDVVTEYLAAYKADYVYKLMSEQEYSEKVAQEQAYLELGY